MAAVTRARPTPRAWPLALERALTAAAARSAAPVLVPTYFGLVFLGMILFGPNGMRAADLTQSARSNTTVAVALWSVWLLITTPAARAVIEIPETFLLRAMPAPRWRFLLVTALHVAAVEALWIGLWARGEGALHAIAVGSAAVGAHGLLVARPSRPRLREIAAALALALAIALAARVSAPLLLAAGAFAAPIGVSAAWTRAPERDARRRSVSLPRAPSAALAVAHLLTVRRAEAALLGRALLLAALGGLAAPLAARGHELSAPSSVSALSLGIAAFTLSIASTGVAASVLRAEAHARFLLDASGTSGGARVLAAAGATAASSALLGLVHGVLASFGAGAGPSLALRLTFGGALLGGALGVAAAWHTRRALAEGSRREGRSLARFVALVGGSIASIALFGEPAVALTAAAAVLLAARSSAAALALPEPLCARRRPPGFDVPESPARSAP